MLQEKADKLSLVALQNVKRVFGSASNDDVPPDAALGLFATKIQNLRSRQAPVCCASSVASNLDQPVAVSCTSTS